MNLLFKNIPIGTKDFELAEFIGTNFNAADSGNEGLSVKVGGIEMLEREDSFTHPIEQFGIVRIYSSEIALSIIKQLDGAEFNGCKITVRKYTSRLTSNDPRVKNLDPPKDFGEQRRKDRRVHDLIYSRLI